MRFSARQQDISAMGLLIIVITLIYGQALSHQLISFDDPYFINTEPHVLSGVSWENTAWAWATTKMAIWHPITWLSYQLESSLFGPANDSARFLTNILLHLLNSILVYLLAQQLGFNKLYALVVSLLFASHPQHVEVVAWVSERKELLASGFVLASTRQYLRYLRKPSAQYYLLSLLFFLCALLSKASAAPLAIFIPFLHVLYSKSDDPTASTTAPNWTSVATWRTSLASMLFSGLPFLIAALWISTITIDLQASAVSEKFISLESGFHYIAMMGMRFAWYLQMSVWPSPLSLFHFPPASLSTWLLLKSALICIAFFSMVWRYKADKLFLTGIIWFILFLAPTSGLVPVEAIYVSDRYSYQPHIGLFIALLALLKNHISARRAMPIHALVILSAGIFAVLSWQQLRLWNNSITLFEHEVSLHPNSDIPLIQLGYAYGIAGKNQIAEKHFTRAIELNPQGTDGYAYQGFLAAKEHHYAKAEKLFARAIAGSNRNAQQIYEHLVWLQSSRKQHEQAARYLKQGLDAFPDSVYLIELKIYYRRYYPQISVD